MLGNRDKLRPDWPLGLYADFTFTYLIQIPIALDKLTVTITFNGNEHSHCEQICQLFNYEPPSIIFLVNNLIFIYILSITCPQLVGSWQG